MKSHDPLTVGQNVVCQNVHNKRWDRTGVIIESCDFRQYKVKIDGSGRISLLNHLHLKPLLYIKPHLPLAPPIDTNQNGVNDSEQVTEVNQQSQEGSTIEQSNTEPLSLLPLRSVRLRRVPQHYGDWTT